MRTLAIILLSLLIGVDVLISSSFGRASEPEGESRQAQLTITIRDVSYNPPVLHIRLNETVTWVNRDHHDHTVVHTHTDDQPLFRSGNIKTGESFQHRFVRAGTFHYSCTYHPRMRGRIVVTE